MREDKFEFMKIAKLSRKHNIPQKFENSLHGPHVLFDVKTESLNRRSINRTPPKHDLYIARNNTRTNANTTNHDCDSRRPPDREKWRNGESEIGLVISVAGLAVPTRCRYRRSVLLLLVLLLLRRTSAHTRVLAS